MFEKGFWIKIQQNIKSNADKFFGGFFCAFHIVLIQKLSSLWQVQKFLPKIKHIVVSTDDCKQKKSHTWEEDEDTTQNFFLALTDEPKEQILKKLLKWANYLQCYIFLKK